MCKSTSPEVVRRQARVAVDGSVLECVYSSALAGGAAPAAVRMTIVMRPL